MNICLGTDSLASSPHSRRGPASLNMFAEMREFARRHPTVGSDAILRMATVNGARALRRSGRLGELSSGAQADLIAVPYTGSPRSASRAAVMHEGPVRASMIGGRWAVAPR